MPDLDRILPVTRFKRELLDILKTMQEDDATISVTKNGEPVGVMMTQRRYESIMETIEILADRRVMADLAASAADFREGRILTDEEVWQE
jgi:prevent-host-death family protein